MIPMLQCTFVAFIKATWPSTQVRIHITIGCLSYSVPSFIISFLWWVEPSSGKWENTSPLVGTSLTIPLILSILSTFLSECMRATWNKGSWSKTPKSHARTTLIPNMSYSMCSAYCLQIWSIFTGQHAVKKAYRVR